MNIDTSTIVVYAGTKVLPALWGFITAHFQTQAQVIEKYCQPAVTLPANMTPFQQAQYDKQCGNLNVYTILAKPASKPPEPEAKGK